MQAQKRPRISPGTMERLADLRLEVSRREGRVVTTDFVVAGLLDAAEREKQARAAYEAIRHEYAAVTKDIDKTLPIDAYIEMSNYARGLKMALDLMAGKITVEGETTGAAELFAHPKGMQFTVSIGIPEIRLLGAADPEREARLAMIEWLERQG